MELTVLSQRLLILLGVFVFSGCSTTTNESKDINDKASAIQETASSATNASILAVEDAWIASSLKGQYIVDEYIDAGYINIEVDQGHISLFGRVQSDHIHNRAISIAKSITGVKAVTSHLVIVPRY